MMKTSKIAIGLRDMILMVKDDVAHAFESPKDEYGKVRGKVASYRRVHGEWVCFWWAHTVLNRMNTDRIRDFLMAAYTNVSETIVHDPAQLELYQQDTE